MREFKRGDRVRLRSVPEMTGEVAEGPDHDGDICVDWNAPHQRVCGYRLSAELELIPDPTSPVARLKETRDRLRRMGDAPSNGFVMADIVDLVIDAIARVSP